MDKVIISNAFQTFISEAPEHSDAWMEAVRKLDLASKLDKKTEELAYIAVLAAVRLESGVDLCQYLRHKKLNFLCDFSS